MRVPTVPRAELFKKVRINVHEILGKRGIEIKKTIDYGPGVIWIRIYEFYSSPFTCNVK